jgi:mono/diheme cytochrome c family protein
MKMTFAAVVLAAWTAGWGFEVGASQASPPQTIWSGVYTEAQAKRGETTYGKTCASCHAPDLSGVGQSPALAGKDFNGDWNDGPLSDLFERIRISMPADSPGSLKPPEVADLVAFILSQGGFPAGQTELPSQADALKPIKFLTQKP